MFDYIFCLLKTIQYMKGYDRKAMSSPCVTTQVHIVVVHYFGGGKLAASHTNGPVLPPGHPVACSFDSPDGCGYLQNVKYRSIWVSKMVLYSWKFTDVSLFLIDYAIYKYELICIIYINYFDSTALLAWRYCTWIQYEPAYRGMFFNKNPTTATIKNNWSVRFFAEPTLYEYR